MTRLQYRGTQLVFWSLPFVALYKGKGLIISYMVLFCLYGIKPLIATLRPQALWGSFRENGHKYVIAAALVLLIYGFIIFPASLLLFIRCSAVILTGYSLGLGLMALDRVSQEKCVTLFLKGYLMFISLYAAIILSYVIFHFIFPMVKILPCSREFYLRGTVILVTLTVPALLATRHIKPLIPSTTRLIVFISALLLLILMYARPDAARFAILAALIMGGLLWVRPSLNKYIFYGIAGVALIYPFFCLYVFNEYTLFDRMRFLPQSYQHRVQMWRLISDRIMDHFLCGHGFDASTALKDLTARCAYLNPIAYLKHQASVKAIIVGKTPYSWGGVICYKDPVIGSHPHNGFLQLWYEFGVAGILLFLYSLWHVCRKIMTYNRLYQIAGFAILIIYGMFCFISFNIWQNWLLSLGGLTIVLFRLIHRLYPRGI